MSHAIRKGLSLAAASVVLGGVLGLLFASKLPANAACPEAECEFSTFCQPNAGEFTRCVESGPLSCKTKRCEAT
jgi:hypothetical protein